ncbi:hypothetical protein HID58_095823 [Brassica napus]|uniref:Uncharacterized protein n=1 Tax=Brassica napus TaxID=3708 RepID=A0ABQ7X3U3_BRANA|nr:hypothetical protein HID58_092499 [Brassica napus]KAH0850064.1 hypothetical protein HID58_095823 [Brassica napus]
MEYGHVRPRASHEDVWAIKREDRAMYKDRASGTDRRSVPMTVQPTPLAQVIRLSPNQDVQCEGGLL